MIKIIIDTNVLVSSLIQKSYPYLILNKLIQSEFEICISNELFEEYTNVLNRNKFKKIPNFTKNSDFLLNYLFKISNVYNPQIKIDLIKDKSDNKLLELAEESKADVLITGNFNDFNMSSYKNTLILSPKDFWEKYNM